MKAIIDKMKLPKDTLFNYPISTDTWEDPYKPDEFYIEMKPLPHVFTIDYSSEKLPSKEWQSKKVIHI